MLTLFLNLMIWIGQHPWEFLGWSMVIWCSASVIGAVVYAWACRSEDRDREESDAYWRRHMQATQEAKPRAPGFPSRRVG